MKHTLRALAVISDAVMFHQRTDARHALPWHDPTMFTYRSPSICSVDELEANSPVKYYLSIESDIEKLILTIIKLAS